MAINVNVQYNGELLPDIILLTQCYLHRGTCLNAMKRFYICSLLIPPKRFDISPPNRGMLRRSRCALIFLQTTKETSSGFKFDLHVEMWGESHGPHATREKKKYKKM